MKENTVLEILKNDKVEQHFDTANEMLNFLQTMQESDRWDTILFEGLNLISTKTDNILYADETQIEEHKGLFLETLLGNYIVSDLALPTLCDRALNNSSIFKRLSYEDKATMLNISWPYMSEDSGTALVRGNKILAVHSGKSNGYVPLPQGDLFQTCMNSLYQEFHNAEFKYGSYAHDLTYATFILGSHKEKVFESYKNAWIRAGYPLSTLETYHPGVQFYTSDTGSFCATIYPVLYRGNTAYKLGNALTVKHWGSASIEKFEELFPQIFAKTKESFEKLSSLLDIQIYNPINCMFGVAKALRLPKKPVQEVIKVFEETEGSEIHSKIYNAHELYFALLDVLSNSHTDKLQGAARLNLEESVSRLLTIKWKEYDTNVEVKW